MLTLMPANLRELLRRGEKESIASSKTSCCPVYPKNAQRSFDEE
jgi:hypothetical protein